jgi:TPR repeat protein
MFKKKELAATISAATSFKYTPSHLNDEKGPVYDNRDELTIDQLHELAEQNVLWAMTMLVNHYGEGHFVNRNYDEAMRLLLKAANLGDPGATLRAANCYIYGVWTKQDIAKAVPLFRSSAALGESISMCNLGAIYLEGKGVQKNYAKSVFWFRKAAALGQPIAMLSLGKALLFGVGTKKNQAEAQFWFENAVHLGNSEAALQVGRIHWNGMVFKENPSEGVSWFMKAAKLDNAIAKFFFGALILIQEGVEVININKSNAIEKYKNATKFELLSAKNIAVITSFPDVSMHPEIVLAKPLVSAITNINGLDH